MKTYNDKTDLIEQAFINARRSEDSAAVLSESWKASLMQNIQAEAAEEDREFEMVTRNIIMGSWIAAGIAAALVFVSALIYQTAAPDSSAIENDIHALYGDSIYDLTTLSDN